VVDANLPILQRVLASTASAFIFISGGVLAARLSFLHPDRADLLIGIYYCGIGIGIVVSALLVPFAPGPGQRRWRRSCVATGLGRARRHNLPSHAWSAGISAFTTVFALGQIIGPLVIGWIADGPGGFQQGLMDSALALFIGAVLASRQPPLAQALISQR
jgi:hypothetical protein